MTDLHISTEEAKQDKLFYVVANIIIINQDSQTCLLLKRGDNEKVLPGKWGFPGGKLEHKDVTRLLDNTNNKPIEGIDNILGILARRESKEECGLDVDEESQIIKNKVFVRPDGIPVFMTTLASKYQGGDVILEDGAITDHAWVSADELKNYDCIEGIADEALTAFKLLK